MSKQKPVDVNLVILDTLRDILIVQLTNSGAKQQEIRKLLGVDIIRVNRVARLLKNRKIKTDKNKNGDR